MRKMIYLSQGGDGMIKLWDSLTEDAQNALLIVGFLIEAWFLFAVMQ